jgi:hypothetical protein
MVTSRPGRPEGLIVVDDGGVLSDADIKEIVLADGELAGFAFVPGDEVARHRKSRRRTVTTLPMIFALSPRIGAYAGLCGISQTCPSTFLNVLTVASWSPDVSLSIMAATMSPFSMSDSRRTTTQSPSVIAALIIDSPTTLSMMRFPSPTSCFGSEMTSSTDSSARIGPPAAIRPTSGTGAIPCLAGSAGRESP